MRAGLLLLLSLSLSACGAGQAKISPERVGHPGESWWAYRASLTPGQTVAQAKVADAALSEAAPPEEGPHRLALAQEAAALWRDLCAPCHGSRGDLEGVDLSAFDKPPRRWDGMGPSFGFFFGGDKMRAGIYRSIRDGKDAMPPFGPVLSREQLWALVRHIEGF